MKLKSILEQCNDVTIVGNADIDISSISSDSRTITPNALFAAMPGSKDNGSAYIADALAKGAAAVLTQTAPQKPLPVPYVLANSVRKALGEAANALYNHPADKLRLVGVTGTNGKTTTAYLIRHIMRALGHPCGMLGTIEYDNGHTAVPAPLTTPDTVQFTRSLADMAANGCDTAMVECSSHALDQYRVWPHRFAAAIFTNLTRDHLDYHQNMDAYMEAKRRLFTGLDKQAVAVLNFKDPAARRMASGCTAQIWGYAPQTENTAALHGARIWNYDIPQSNLSGQTFIVRHGDTTHEFHTHLVGRHNVENCLGAVLTALALGAAPHAVAEALITFPGVPGRLERIESGTGITAFVDYAHTDDALRTALSILRPLTPGRLLVVFGCGGDRDKGKRPLMAKAAEEHADIVVVTSDNPRTEDPQAIIADILPGFIQPGNAVVEADRPTAICKAAKLARPGDVLLVAGKGHEDYQIIGTVKHHMDDRELVRDAFSRLCH